MSEIIQLNHQVENTYEFDLEIEGLSNVKVAAWFVIIVKGMEISFKCKQDKNHFSCKIRPMPFLEKTTYKGAVRLVADDYYFEVVNDLIVNVTGNLSFERSDVKNMTVKSTIKGKQKVEESTVINDGATVQTNVQRVETPVEIAKRVLDESKAKPTKDVAPRVVGEEESIKPAVKASTVDSKKTQSKEIPSFNVRSGTNTAPVKKDIPTKPFKTPNTPEPQEKVDLPTGYDKKTDVTDKELSSVESKNKVVKDVILKQPEKIAANESAKFIRKGTVAESIAVSKKDNKVIEEEVSEFVSAEQAAKEERLRNILKGFTVAPNATATKAKFVRKT